MNRIRQKWGKNYLEILLHVLSWTTLVLIGLVFLDNSPGPQGLFFQIASWVGYFLFFYLNYSYLIPHLLFNKKPFLYILYVIVALVAFTLLRNYVRGLVFIDLAKPQDLNWLPENFSPEFRPRRNMRMFFGMKEFLTLNGFLIFYFGSTSLRLLLKWKEDEQIKKERERQKISAELAYLKQQINPHFLFNSLNSIYSLANRKSEKTPDTILKLSEVLRYMLYDADRHFVPLEKEINNIRNVLDLQRQRLNSKTTINFKVSGSNYNQSISPLLLLPIVENAIKYGSDNYSKSEINIHVFLEENMLSLQTSNPILYELHDKEKKNSSGIGLKNVKRRLELSYPGNYELRTKEEKKMFFLDLKVRLL